MDSLSSRVLVPTPQKVSGIVLQSAPLVPSRMTRRGVARGEPEEPREPLLAMARVPLLPGSISCPPGPGRVHGDRPPLSINRRPQKRWESLWRTVPGTFSDTVPGTFSDTFSDTKRFPEPFPTPPPFLTRRAEDERCRGSPADRAGVSKERPSGRCDADGHWVPAGRSTSWLGAPEAGDPWRASG